jgi:hypothetical protein
MSPRVPFRPVFVALSILFFSLTLHAQTVYYLNGDPLDQANKVTATPGTPTFSTTAPTGAVPVLQLTTPFANADVVANPLAAFWSGSYTGNVTGVLDLKWYWSTPNPAALAIGTDLEVTIFADPDYTAEDLAQPGKIIGRAIVPLSGISATPTLIENLIPVHGIVQNTLLIQVVPEFVDTGEGIFVQYGSPTTPSSFTIHEAPPRIEFTPATQASGYAPRYKNYNPTPDQLAAGIGNDAGEPSIGSNWFTGKVWYVALLQSLRVTFDDACATTPSAIFENKSSPITSTESFDPILYTEHLTGRTIVSQLMLGTTTSASAYTDDDGETWLPSQGAGIASGIDHQTLGGGPFHSPRPAAAQWPTATYYCAQDLVLAGCAVSLDGGRTYGPAVPTYTSQCGGLHGHIKVGPDGTAYLPNKGCGGQQAVVVSEDNGMSWDIRKVPNSLGANSDPSVAIAKDDRVYFSFIDNDNFPIVAVSDDHGHNWYNIKDVGKLANIHNAVFAAAVAGDKNRAAVAYLGTTTPGDLQAREFPGVWHLYISSTFDGGNTWHTVNATPNDPVQRGPIWLKGGGEISRNLLDFMDATIDREGRVLVGYADGCTGDCVQTTDTARGNTYEDITAIVRQTGGRRMFAEFDPPDLSAPGAPTLTVTRNGSLSNLTWSQANNGGYPTTNYSVFRQEPNSDVKLLATVSNASGWTDATAEENKTYVYRVSASNGGGSSCGTNAVTAAPRGNSCTNGVKVLSDPNGDQTGAPANAALDIQSVSIAEPYYAGGAQKVTFVMKVNSLASLPPNAQWRVIWNFPTTVGGSYYADMRTSESGAVSFEYGEILVTGAVVTSVGQPSTLGAADAESNYSADGTIRIVLSTDKIGNAVPGDLIGGLLARTYLVTGSQATTFRAAIDAGEADQTYKLVGNGYCAPPVITCLEDDDASMDYSLGWQGVDNSNASAGHFHMGGVVDPQYVGQDLMQMSINVPAGQYGAITYHYATSRKGGTAEIFIDGVSQGTIDYLGFTGDTATDAQFGPSKRFGGLQPGNHLFEIRPTGNGAVYVDRICLESSTSNGSQQAEYQTSTSTRSNSLLPGVELVLPVTLNTKAKALSVVLEATGGTGKIVLVNPLGVQVATATTNAKGFASIAKQINGPGVYLVKTINLSAVPIKVWTSATQRIAR